MDNWISCHVKVLNYLGKRPGIIVPDNAPTASYRPVKNNPGRRIQERYADFADYYDILLVPARPGKPRDKAAVERAVQLVYTRILGYFDGPTRFLAFLQPLEGVVTFVSCFLLFLGDRTSSSNLYSA
ncbi:hypothetical protein [Corynebacterium striatum]|uniref:hypothetical protein n=1 Tax=Corynebacterium striatum TaxID=43770 RepID=UPI000A4D8540|nr:hypothetical protein [Corynebacterium striatum]